MAFYQIDTIDQLTKNLNLGPGHGGYLDLFQSIKLSSKELEHYCSWKENRYTRNCISSCDDYELLLMCWGKGHESPIHNYNLQEGWVKVFAGELILENYDVDLEAKCGVKVNEIVLSAGESTYINDEMGFHKVKNSYAGKSLSLHLNIRPVKNWEVFRGCRQAIIQVQPLFDTKSGSCD